jgi:hypothetical protein
VVDGALALAEQVKINLHVEAIRSA